VTETEAPKPNLPQIMPVGGEVVAVVPQSVEEIFRLSKGIVQSGLAPYALTGKTDTEAQFTKATSAVAIVIMAGAELGLPPMVSLRSFTAINGRPALYGDGLINVVRRSGRAAKIEVGFKPGTTDVYDDDAAGFCTAIRKDTGEEKTVAFTVRQAKRAGLWDDKEKKRGQVWKDGQKVWINDAPNDSPWYRYPERMLGWRAAGFCLRELFGDVLGGITDDWEAREISGMVDITPQQPRETERPTPPPPPTDDEDETAPPAGTAASGEPGADSAEEQPGETTEAAGEAPSEDRADFLAILETDLKGAHTDEEVDAAFDEADPHGNLAGDDEGLSAAFALKAGRKSEIKRELEAAGQGSMFPGDKP
jgi:hypothetical protein